MFKTYEEAKNYILACRRDYKESRVCYIVTQNGYYSTAFGKEELEYAESLGWILVA